MKIIVCYKWVIDEQDIKIKPDDLSLDTARAKYKISEYDRNAIEEGVLLAEKTGGSLEALTFGTSVAKQSYKDALSRGPQKVYAVIDPLAEAADAALTANVLAAAVRKIGDFDLILCGEGSSDAYNQQVGPRLAALLNVPGITFVNQIELEDDKFKVTRKLKGCLEILNLKGPAVMSVTPQINKPRIPSLKQILAAAKKPAEEFSVSDLDLASESLKPKTKLVSVKGFVMDRKRVIYKEKDAKENVAKLVESLEAENLC